MATRAPGARTVGGTTQTLKKTQASRQYDHLYDPTYHVSSGRDHERAESRASASASQIKKVPHAENMFSALAHHPRHEVTVNPSDPVPGSVARTFHASKRSAAASQEYQACEPRGRHSSLFRGMPAVQYSRGMLSNTMVRFAMDDSAKEEPETPAPTSRTVGTMTDYREMETQTEAWTPQYVVRPGSAPEVLTLAALSHGAGLPAGLAEVEMIERAREKRKWEKTLPPASDNSRGVERARMMEEQEAREWKQREEEIEKMQEERMRLLQSFVADLEEQKQEAQDERMDRLWQARQDEKEVALARKTHTGLKMLRKLGTTRRQVDGAGARRRDIVNDYATSAAFAPTTRLGAAPTDADQDRFIVDSHLTSSYHGLLDLEASIPASVTTPRVRRQPLRSARRDGGSSAARTRRHQSELERLDRTFDMRRTGAMPQQAALRTLRRREKPKQRPPTPEVAAPAEGAEEREAALVLLQSVLRGRAVQNEMYDGKEQRSELIAELRSTHALQAAQQQIKAEERDRALERRRHREASRARTGLGDAAIAKVQAGHVGRSLDFLSKELVRLQEERRVHAFALLADRQRRLREAEEAGKRQAEEARREQSDEVFRQVVGVHNETIESYLEDLLIGAQEQVTDEEARRDVREQARKIDEVASGLQASGQDQTAVGAESIAADLLSSFLLPEVERQTRREAIKQDQRKHIRVAHMVTHGALVDTVEPALRVALAASAEAGGSQTQIAAPDAEAGVSCRDEVPASAYGALSTKYPSTIAMFATSTAAGSEATLASGPAPAAESDAATAPGAGQAFRRLSTEFPSTISMFATHLPTAGEADGAANGEPSGDSGETSVPLSAAEGV